MKNLWVHQRRLHVQESRVKAILESVENQVLIDKLQLFEHKIHYDYENNIKVLKEKSGILLVCKKSSDNYQVYVMKFFFTTLILYTFCGYENSINLNFRIIRAVRNVRNLFPVKTISRISKKITEISVKLSLILNVPSLLNMIIKNVIFSVWVRRALWGRVQPIRAFPSGSDDE